MTPIPFPRLLHAFFHDWLVQQRNVSHHTVLSYRDSWRMFLQFVALKKVTSVAKLGLSDLTEVQDLAFLEDIEHVRSPRLERGTVDWPHCIASSASLLAVSRRLRNAPQYCEFLTKRQPSERSSAWMMTRSLRFSPNQTVRESKVNAITSYWHSFTTPVPVFRRRWISLPCLFTGRRHTMCDCSVKGERSGTALSGQRQSSC